MVKEGQREMKIDSKGRFVRQYPKISVTCLCGTIFKTTENRVNDGRGRYCSRGCLYQYRNTPNGKRHHAWKGDDVGYSALHSWIKRKLGKPNYCDVCKTVSTKRFEWANISKKYKRELSDWRSLCSKCHHRFDDIANRGWETKKKWQKI